MAGMNLGSSFGAGGRSDALFKLLVEQRIREMQERGYDLDERRLGEDAKWRQQQFEADQQYRRDQLTSLDASRKQAAADRLADNATAAMSGLYRGDEVSPEFREQVTQANPLLKARFADTVGVGPTVGAQTPIGNVPMPMLRAKTVVAGGPHRPLTPEQQAALAELTHQRNRLFDVQHPTPTPDREPLEYVIGDDGKPLLMPRSQAIGRQRASAASRPTSGTERKALGFFNRAKTANDNVAALESQFESLMDQGQLAAMPNLFQTPAGQKYVQAQRMFTEARLRQDSGAAIPENEFKNDRLMYFIQPGDTKATIAQKRQARAMTLASMAFQSGQAFREYYGEEAEGLEQALRDASISGGGKTSGGAPKVGDVVDVGGGRKVKITIIHPDGSFDGDPVR